jgi:predicted Rossmann fold nucleotide-binding protein DprA/Smf involved in DNA uptake
MMYSTDSLAMLMLCSRLGLTTDADLKALTLSEWNVLAEKISISSLKRPGAMLGLPADELVKELIISPEQAETIADLLDRSGTIAIELERLESLGINVLTRADEAYPTRYKERLGKFAPPILFYSGEKALLGQSGIAIVGSRDVDSTGKMCAEMIGNACGLSGKVLYSGGAKGVDTLSMNACLLARGCAVGVMANNMDRAIRDPEYRSAIQRGDFCIITPYLPSAPFNVGAAMGRNKLIYSLADLAIVVASSAHKGGTWNGAIENLKKEWVPLFVVEYDEMPEGNKLLLEQGGIKLPESKFADYSVFIDYLDKIGRKRHPTIIQPGLF